MDQHIITANGSYEALAEWFTAQHIRRLLLVCDSVFPLLKISGFIEELKSPEVILFDHFQPNPLYESVV